MGAFTSRRNADVEENIYISTVNAYRYPPKSGCYFGSHFIMGGEKFETTQPESYLFGENADLNFLGSRPTSFPYPAPQVSEPTKTLKSLVNIRKDSLRFVKAIENASPKKTVEEGSGDVECSTKYNIEFTFDTDVRVAITVYYFATEEMTGGQLTYNPRDPAMNSETYHYKRGANQTFNQTTHVIEPSQFGEEEWQFNPDKDLIPVVVHCVVEEEMYSGHSHALFGYVEKFNDGGYVLKPLKQKQMVDGLCYLLQEIYGIENKNRERSKLDDELEDTGSECVICMCETRDTLILPCRHLCLCNMCADNLRYQANNCPICRSPFRALLQINALRKKLPSLHSSHTSDSGVSQEGVPAGYEAVSLIEALNGPESPSSPQTTTPHIPLPVGGGIPPDGESPSMKRKGRRLSGRASSRRNQKNSKPIQETRHPPPKSVVPDSASTPEVSVTTVIHGVIPEQSVGDVDEIVLEARVTSHGESPGDLPLVRLPTGAEVIDCEADLQGETKPTELDKNIALIDDKNIPLIDEFEGRAVTTTVQLGEEDESLRISLLEERLSGMRSLGDDLEEVERASGSSYSSTSSGKGLLEGVTTATDSVVTKGNEDTELDGDRKETL